MKTHVLVLVPYDVECSKLSETVTQILEAHRQIENDETFRRGRFDYLVGAFAKSLNDPSAEGRLPLEERKAWSGNVCDKLRVPPELIPGALVTLDGKWHDLGDFGWRMTGEMSRANQDSFTRWTDHYRDMLAAAADCWIVEVWAHS